MEEILKQILKELQRPTTEVKSVSIKEAARIMAVSYTHLRGLKRKDTL